MWPLIALFLFNVTVVVSEMVHYCGSKLCRYTNAHTFCQFSDEPGPQCKGFIEAPLSDEEKIRILMRMNQRRAAAATEQLRRFPAASNMMKLMWVDELAREAQLWANQCEPPSRPEGHDACRDLYSVSVGQGVASVEGEAPGLRPESMVDLWYMQYMFYKNNVSDYVPPSKHQLYYYGDFAQLLYAQTYMVGCGRSRFKVSSSGRMRSVERLVCNFAPRGPGAGRAIWDVGDAASNCPQWSLPDVNISALCTFQRELDESVHQGNVISLEEHILLDTIFEIERNKSLNYVGSIDEIYLTKMAVILMMGVAHVQDNNGVQKRNVYGSDTSMDQIKDDLENNVDPKMESTNVTPSKPTDITFSLQKVTPIGRPKSSNLADFNDNNNIEVKMDDRQVLSHDLPVAEKKLNLDYEYNDSTDELVETSKIPSSPSKVTTEITIPTAVSTVMSSTETTQTNEIETVDYLPVSTEGSPQTSDLFSTRIFEVIKINNNDSVTSRNNTEDVYNDGYLNYPEIEVDLDDFFKTIEQKKTTMKIQSPSTINSTIFLDQTEVATTTVLPVTREDTTTEIIDYLLAPRHFENDTELRKIKESYLNFINDSYHGSFVDKYAPFLNEFKTKGSNDILSLIFPSSHAVYSKGRAFFVLVLVPILLLLIVL